MSTDVLPLPERIAEAEARLGVTLPQSWKDWVALVPGYAGGDVYCDVLSFDGDLLSTGPLLQPHKLLPLSDERWSSISDGVRDWHYPDIEGRDSAGPEDRSRVIPFIEDGAGNAYAFLYLVGAAEPLVIDCDHETGGWDASTWPTFQAWLDDHHVPFLAGSTFVFTGRIDGMTRAEAQEIAKGFGAKVVDSVTAKTSFLVTGEGAGSEAAEAVALDVRVIDAAQWLDLANQR